MWIRRLFVVVVCAIVLATGVALAVESDTDLMAEVTAFGRGQANIDRLCRQADEMDMAAKPCETNTGSKATSAMPDGSPTNARDF